METTQTPVNFRRSLDGEIIAVLLNTKGEDMYLCLSLYDNMHFSANMDWLKKCKNLRAKDGYNLPELSEFVKARGYSNVVIKLRLM